MARTVWSSLRCSKSATNGKQQPGQSVKQSSLHEMPVGDTGARGRGALRPGCRALLWSVNQGLGIDLGLVLG